MTTTRHALPARRPAEACGSQLSCALLPLDKEAPLALPGASAVTAAEASSRCGSGWRYTKALHTSPLLTKAASSGLVFAASDWCAQSLEALPGSDTDLPRLLTCAMVGVLFGPAAHFWYQLMQRSFPRQRARDTLCKTVLG